jgi:ketosteroid isomerase-like protein
MPENIDEKLAVVQRLIAAFNAPDFDELSDILADNIVFSHKNKGMEGSGKEKLLENIRLMNEAFPGRVIGETKRFAINGDVVFREGYWTGKAAHDVPGFATAGELAYLDTVTLLVIRGGQIHEWCDFG